MVVLLQVGIKSPGISLPFYNINNSNSGKREQGSVHCIQGNIGKIREKLFMDFVCTGMIFCLFERLVNGNPLRRDLESMCSAQLGAPAHIDFLFFIHSNN